MDLFADRLKKIPPYLFMQLRDKIRQAEKKGVDLISLAIGDPVEPTPAYIVETLRSAALDPANHQYPTDEHKGMLVFRKAVARWYERKYGVTLNPETINIPRTNTKGCWSSGKRLRDGTKGSTG